MVLIDYPCNDVVLPYLIPLFKGIFFRHNVLRNGLHAIVGNNRTINDDLIFHYFLPLPKTIPNKSENSGLL